jgi:hypothetical protein
MKRKLLAILSICALVVAGFAVFNTNQIAVTADSTTVYVASNGSDEGEGTSTSPYGTLDKALSSVVNGGTIIVKDTVSISSWSAHGKTVTVKGGILNASGLSEVEIKDNVTFTDINLTVDAGASVYLNGYKTTIGTGVVWSNEIQLFAAGKANTTVACTDLTVLSGTYTHIYGGSNSGVVAGDTNLVIGGDVNNSPAVDAAISNHSDKYYIYGGGNADTIQGKTNVTLLDNAKAVYVYGGSCAWNNKIEQGTNVTVKNGTYMSIYGGSKGGGLYSGANVEIYGGSMQQVFGGNESFQMQGDATVKLFGGTITRRIYAGCYSNDSDAYVTGQVTLEIGGDVDIPLNASYDDRGIYARSRYKGDLESSQLIFTSEFAYNSYNDSLGAKDWGASYIMGSIAAADEYHYYTYTAQEGVITQTCAYHNYLSATATIALDENVSLQYSGFAIEPIKVDYSDEWEYASAIISYEDNVECGIAAYTVQFGDLTVEDSFLIIEAPVILGGSVRTAAPCGLRFQSKVSKELVDAGASFGTLVIPKEELGNNQLTIDTGLANNIEQTIWATEGVKEMNPHDYEEGYEYFNAVLTDIPEEHYDKVIVARSYIYANGQYYYAETVERSVAQVAAYAIQDGYTNDILYEYVDKALADSTVLIENAIEIYEGETYQLNLSGNKGYVAIWSSSDESIATVDNTGKITALKKEGKVVIMAKIGNIVAECTLTVKHRWTGYY